MSKNYDIIHHIQSQCDNTTISHIVTRLFTRLDKQNIYGSALSSSIALILSFAMNNIQAQLILGTVGIPSIGKRFPSAWIEVNDKIYDLSIYFDTLRHPVLQEHNIVIKPQINVDYNNADVDYFDFQYIDIFDMSDIARTVGQSFKEFCNNSPHGDDIWCDIFYATNLNQTKERFDKLQEIASGHTIKKTRE